jgi:hypothetical protein
MILPVRALTRGVLVVAVLFASADPAVARTTRSRGRSARAAEAHVAPGLRVAVQPIAGEHGPVLRGQIARLLRARGCRVVTSLTGVTGTSQYVTLAKDNRLAAFVSADLQEGRSRQSVTFLVWDGATGNVLGRWSASAASKNLAKVVAKGFWKSLGPRFEGAQAPASEELGEAPPIYVNAGEPLP